MAHADTKPAKRPATTPAVPALVAVRFRVAHTRDELIDAFSKEAPAFAAMPGLRWKLWTLNESTREFAGIYLFDNLPTARAFIDGPVIASLRATPEFSAVEADAYPVLESLSAITRGPLEA